MQSLGERQHIGFAGEIHRHPRSGKEARQRRHVEQAAAVAVSSGPRTFGGSRASGTNDKAGSLLNLVRWASPRAVKENFIPPRSFGYPFMAEA